MSVQYDRYLIQHIQNVGKGLAWFQTNLPDILREGPDINYELQFARHDASKYDKEEYDAYDAYFYGPGKSFKVTQNFNRAWLRHIHRNPHHWQHWVLLEDDPATGGNVCIEMPYHYVIEMICDWWSFSWAKDDLTEIFDWWDAHERTIQFHKNTRRVVLDILDRMREKLLETSDELEHHGIKGQKWGVRRTPEELAAARGLASEEKSDTIVSDAIRSGKVSTKINREKQMRHTQSGHSPGRSYLNGDLEYAQELVDRYSGKGEAVCSKGTWTHRERIVADEPIGVHIGLDGKETASNIAVIVYSKTGTHVYPARKDDSDET